MHTSTEQTGSHPPIPSGRQRRPPVIVLVCVAIIVIILLGGSLVGLLESRNSASGKKVKAVATPTVAPSPTWIPTAVTPPAESFFYDTFVNNSHGWSLASNDGYYRILVNNTLILANTNPDTPLIESVPANTNLDDYLVSVDFTVNRGDTHDSVGLYVRGDSTLSHDYRVDMNGNGTFDVAKEWLDPSKVQPAQTTMLVPPTHASELKPAGQQNTLSVIMLGPTITVVLNNVALKTVNDPSYTNGQVALFARHGSSSSGVNVSFSRVEIDRLASPFATPTPTPSPTPPLTPTTGQP